VSSAGARRFARALAATYAGALLLAQAAWAERSGDVAKPLWAAAARCWIERLAVPRRPDASSLRESQALALEEPSATAPAGAATSSTPR
jgi:hypothetical protein